MNKFLPTIINSLSSNSRLTVTSLINQMKESKYSVSSLVSKLNTFKLDTNFSPSTISASSALDKQVIIDMNRDVSIRMSNYYSSVNLISLLINSIIDVCLSEIDKVEKDIKILEDYIDNYEYISGKDDLFNSNYLEKFDNFSNNYTADNYNFSFNLSDRDGINFGENGNGFIDSKLGVFKIGQNLLRKNILNNINFYTVFTNYDNYTKNSTDFELALNEIGTDAWTITANSPHILTSKLSNYSKYIPYSTENITRSSNYC